LAVITKIEAQKNNKDRYSIFLDDAFAFGVHVDVLVQHGLRKGMELNEEAISELMYDETLKKAVQVGVKQVSYKQRTCKEVKDKLRGLEYSEAHIEAAIEKLEEMGFLDDLRYAEEFVDTRQKRYGRKRIFLELKKRGITENIANNALDTFLDEDAGYAQALEMGRKKYASCSDIDPRKAAARVQGQLLRKGYSYDVVNRIIKELGIFNR
jgi:regulatory protein